MDGFITLSPLEIECRDDIELEDFLVILSVGENEILRLMIMCQFYQIIILASDTLNLC